MRCPRCSVEIPDRALFCPMCAIQVRCRSCGDELLDGARACMMCGALVEENRGVVAEHKPSDGIPEAINKILLQQTEKSRSFRAELTDTAIQSIGDNLGLYIAGRLDGPEKRIRPGQPSPMQPGQLALPTLEGEPNLIIDHEEAVGEREGVDDRVRTSSLGTNAINVDPNAGIESLLSVLDRTSCPEIFSAGRVLEQALWLLRVGRQQFGIDGLTPSEIARVLKDKFGLTPTPQAVRTAFGGAGNLVDRVPAKGGGFRYRLTGPGEAYLAKPANSGNREASRKRSSRRRTPSTSARQSTAESGGAEKPHKSAARRSSSRPGPMAIVKDLISQGFFREPKTIAQIQTHLRDQYGYQYKASDLSPTLDRLLRQGLLQRSKRADNGQFEYISK